MRIPLRLAAAMLPLALLGCPNAGEDRLLTVSATGTVQTFIAFDYNGDRNFQPGVDSPLAGIRVKLVTAGSRDSVAGGVSQAGGLLTMNNVPAGTFLVVVDTTPLADTAVVVRLDSSSVTVLPSDTIGFNLVASYPHVSIARARSASIPLGRKVFIEGVALNALATFSDTTVHMQDTSAAIRATRILPGSFIAPADTLRLRGTLSSRLGQRTIDLVSVFSLGTTLLPQAITLSTFNAAGAQGATLDARPVHIDSAIVTDTLPRTTENGFLIWRLVVNDGSGSLEVRLDCHADAQFCAPNLPPANANSDYVPGNSFRINGVLVPSGAPSIWWLKPRSSSELLKLN